MAIVIKTPKEIESLRIAGKHLSEVLTVVERAVTPGVTTNDLDNIARETILALGDVPAFLGYTPEGAAYPYPAALCVSVNDEVVHGIPTDRILKEGDIVSIDCGLSHNGLFVDSARTVACGKISKKDSELLHRTQEALALGIAAAIGGNKVGDIGYAVEQYIKPFKYGIIRELAGHGVGKKIHEDPYIPNFGKKNTGELLRPGMVIAIEPMINIGSRHIVFDNDGYTIRTEDGSRSAHFEHTVLITEGEPEILT